MIYKGIFFLIAIFFAFIGIQTINEFTRHPLIYNGNIFYNDISARVLDDYLLILVLAALIFIIIKVLIFIISKVLSLTIHNFPAIENLHNDFLGIIHDKVGIKLFTLILFFVAIIFKLTLFDFDLDFGTGGSRTLERFYYGNEFDVYKAYTLIAAFISNFTENLDYYLSVLNIILGSAVISIWYLISNKTGKYSFNKTALALIILFYLPLTAAETILRVELLYIFFLSLSVLVAINLSEKYNLKNLLYLNLILLISCLVREQTIYLLPLYLFLIIIQMDKKHYMASVLSITLTVVGTSSLIANYNTNKYGFDSLFRDRVLIQKMMQYGYLDENMRSTYEKELSLNAQSLLKDMTHIYNTNLLPSRREIHNDKYGMPGLWNLVRPHYQNIYQKTNLSSEIYDEDINHMKKILYDLFSKPQNINKVFNVREASYLMKNVYGNLENDSNVRLMKDIQYIITNDFYLENSGYLNLFELSDMKVNSKLCINRGEPINYTRIWNIQPSKEIYELYKSQKFDGNCLLDVISRINRSYLVSQRTNDYYHIAAQKLAPSFNHETQEYEIHPLLGHVKEIAASMPILYFTQSIVVAISQTGYVPVPSGMSHRFSQVYDNGYFPDFALIALQRIYYIFINFWYVFCLFAFFLSFLIKDSTKRNINLFISLFPLYYGAFMAFASYAEFARLMLPIVPFILYCSFFVIFFIYSMIFNNSLLTK